MTPCNPSHRLGAVVFDLLGTLVPAFRDDEYTATLRAIGDDLGAGADVFFRLWKDIYEKRTTGGFTTTRSTIEWMCGSLGLAPTPASLDRAVAKRLEFTTQALVPHEGIVDLLAAIKVHGLKIGLISDCSADIPDVWPATEMASYFDVTTFSCHAGVRKPMAEIYALTCARLGVGPTACTYVGDGGNSELTGAQAAGMHPVKVVFEAEEGIFRMGHDDAFAGPAVSSVPELAEFILKRCDQS